MCPPPISVTANVRGTTSQQNIFAVDSGGKIWGVWPADAGSWSNRPMIAGNARLTGGGSWPGKVVEARGGDVFLPPGVGLTTASLRGRGSGLLPPHPFVADNGAALWGPSARRVH